MAESAGSLFVTAMKAAYDFEPHEHALIVSAASTLDEIEGMELALAQSGPVIKGSTGQDRVNPLIPALANHRLTLLRILKQLGIEGESAPDSRSAEQKAISEKASYAARVRWKTA
ncbi:hypothetical protein [Streptomyces sp. NPDC047009]|uniref:hypothetical protein n=1 Tax=Streptomyces sp. NPDC047009 TaxID=3154496 RepID=UPI0033E7D93A